MIEPLPVMSISSLHLMEMAIKCDYMCNYLCKNEESLPAVELYRTFVHALFEQIDLKCEYENVKRQSLEHILVTLPATMFGSSPDFWDLYLSKWPDDKFRSYGEIIIYYSRSTNLNLAGHVNDLLIQGSVQMCPAIADTLLSDVVDGLNDSDNVLHTLPILTNLLKVIKK